MKNYRKAKPGEVTCEQCCHSEMPMFWGRLRCVVGCYISARTGLEGNSYAVAKKNTCDKATPKALIAAGCGEVGE